MKRFFSFLLTVTMVCSLFSVVGFAAEAEDVESSAEIESEVSDGEGLTASEDFPSGEITGIVPWGAGGGTDSLMRPLSSIVQTILGQNVNVQNMPGETGSVGLEYVYDQEADGYTLLMSAENPALYEVLEISDLTYEDFECILLIGDETAGLVVAADSPYSSFTELVEAALSGEKIVMGSTGVGGLPWVVSSMIKSVTGAEFDEIEYDGDASANQAVLNGECDFTISKLGSAIEDYNAGVLNFLCVFSDTQVPLLPDVSIVTDEYPDFEQYLPWGPFCGIFVKKDTDPEIVETLREAYLQSYNDSSYQGELADRYVNALGFSGEEADEYISTWAETTTNALKDAGFVE